MSKTGPGMVTMRKMPSSSVETIASGETIALGLVSISGYSFTNLLPLRIATDANPRTASFVPASITLPVTRTPFFTLRSAATGSYPAVSFTRTRAVKYRVAGSLSTVTKYDADLRAPRISYLTSASVTAESPGSTTTAAKKSPTSVTFTPTRGLPVSTSVTVPRMRFSVSTTTDPSGPWKTTGAAGGPAPPPAAWTGFTSL